MTQVSYQCDPGAPPGQFPSQTVVQGDRIAASKDGFDDCGFGGSRPYSCSAYTVADHTIKSSFLVSTPAGWPARGQRRRRWQSDVVRPGGPPIRIFITMGEFNSNPNGPFGIGRTTQCGQLRDRFVSRFDLRADTAAWYAGYRQNTNTPDPAKFCRPTIFRWWIR